MTTANSKIEAPYSPLALQDRSLSWKLGAIVLGTVFLTISSYIEVPMIPVPITMQTFAVTLVGALYGWRLGGATVAAWLLEGAAGMPVFAGGAGGAQHLVGPTGGYLFAFAVVAILTGWLAEKGWNGHKPWLAFASMLLGNGLCLVLGALWLATFIGAEKAITAGILPFIVGGILKSALAAMCLKLWIGLKRKD